jgi:exosortase
MFPLLGFAVNYLAWYLLLAGVAAHASLVWLHVSRMWNAEHFQFFPVALAAAGVLAYNRRTDIAAKATAPRVWIVWVGLLVVLIAQTLACLLSFALTSWLCFLAFLAVMCYASFGWGGLKAAAPVFVMLMVTKPVPTFLEQFLTINLQKAASTLAGNLLNLVGVLHYQQGVVLKLINQSFLTEQACSGIRSLFSSIAAITFLGLMNRYHLLRHLINILQTIMWVMVLNAFRIATVVYVEDQTEFSIADGLAHNIFGYLVFFAIFGLVLSTDCLISAIVVPATHDPAEAPPNMPKAWNEWLIWPSGAIDALAFVCLFGFLALISLRLTFLVPDFKLGFGDPLPAAEQQYLPKNTNGWDVKSFRHVKRLEEDLQGAESYVWQLEKNNKRVLLSLDGSFDHYHDLIWCYSALGWKCNQDRLFSPIEERTKGVFLQDGEYTHLAMSKNTGETGHIIFSSLDRRGTILLPPPALGQETGSFLVQTLINSLRFALGIENSAGLQGTSFEGPLSNIQLVFIPQDPIGEEELNEIKALFLSCRDKIRQTSRFKVE